MTPHVSITLLRTQTDERLIELIAAGHDRAFDAIVDRYRRPLLRYARRFLHEESRAEDVVQAAFVSAWGALRDGVPVRDLRPWLYRIVHNGALNVMKKPGGDDAPLIEASDLRPGPATEVEQREDVRQALDTIAALPERQRAALLAVALEGRSHADVGAELGLNDTAVRQLVSRARATLRVAATAITPWPAAVWLAGLGGAQATDTATRVGELVGGVGAGTLFGGGAMKAGALVAAAGAVVVGVPQVDHVVRTHHRPAAGAHAAAARPSSGAAPAGAAGPATRLLSAPAARPGSGHAPASAPAHGGGSGAPGARSGGERTAPPSGGDDRAPFERRTADDESGAPTDDRRPSEPPATRHESGDDAPAATLPSGGRREHRGSSGDRGSDDAAAETQQAEGPQAPEHSEQAAAPEPAETEDAPESSGGSGSGSGSGDREAEDEHDTEQQSTSASH